MNNSFPLFLLTFVIILLPMQTKATADGPDCYAIRNSSELGKKMIPVFVSPKNNGQVLTHIITGADGLENINCSGNHRYGWCKIRYKSISGWVRSHSLREGRCNSAN